MISLKYVSELMKRGTKERLEGYIADFENVFPRVACAITYALVPWSKNTTPPRNLDCVAIDPYISFPVEGHGAGFVRHYRERFRVALDWVAKANRPAIMVGDAYVGPRGESHNPMPGYHESLWYLYAALADPRFIGLVWFYYGDHVDDENLDGMRIGAFPEAERAHREIGRALFDRSKWLSRQ